MTLKEHFETANPMTVIKEFLTVLSFMGCAWIWIVVAWSMKI